MQLHPEMHLFTDFDTPLDISFLQPPLSVAPPIVYRNHIKFVNQKWLNEAMTIVRENCAKEDNSVERVPPMGFICCHRGGKTRALKEIGIAIKASMPDTVVLSVSLAEYLPCESEKNDLVTALCHRIAYFALDTVTKNSIRGFYDFRKNTCIDELSIIKWLGNQKCVLLIDDLNVGTADIKKKVLRRFYKFLKDNFLSQAGRYLVFTSHAVSTTEQLLDYIDSVSKRWIVIKELPVVRNLSEATTALQLEDPLSAATAIYNGLIPAFILKVQYNYNFHQPKPIEQCFEKINNNIIFDIMRSFVSGDTSDLPSELLPLMNTIGYKTVRWMPRHFEDVVGQFAFSKNISPWVPEIMRQIRFQLSEFKRCVDSDVKTWGKLFTILILIRLLGGEFHNTLMPFAISNSYEVSFNSNEVCSDLTEFRNVNEIKAQLRHSFKTYPHIAVIVPPFVRFENYDLLIVIFETQVTEPRIYAYQCKNGRELVEPKSEDKTVTQAFWMNGQPPEVASCKNKWIVANQSEIESFFGVSGSYWTPDAWLELTASKSKL